SNGDLKRKWTWAVEWLGDELERRPYTGNPQYTYNNWSPPVQSNETSNGYFLERSHSARMTLAKACELCPEECHLTKHDAVASEEDGARKSSSPQRLMPAEVTGPQQHTEPDDQEAPDDHDSSPPEDTTLYPQPPGTQFQQQNNHPHGQPYTGLAAQRMNNPQRPGQRAQENWGGPEETTPAQTKE
ncbi:hypothetical protein AAFF_G00333470, partial [Aldrovandia affinis]